LLHLSLGMVKLALMACALHTNACPQMGETVGERLVRSRVAPVLS
jgi:hypothetical protein